MALLFVTCNTTIGDVCEGTKIQIQRHIAGNASHPCSVIINNWKFETALRSNLNMTAMYQWSFSMSSTYDRVNCPETKTVNVVGIVIGTIVGVMVLCCICYGIHKSGCKPGNGYSSTTSYSTSYGSGSSSSYSYAPAPKSNWSGGYTVGGQYYSSFNQAKAAGGNMWSS